MFNQQMNFGNNNQVPNQNHNTQFGSLGLGLSPNEDMYHRQQMQNMNQYDRERYMDNLRYQIQKRARDELLDPRVLLQQEVNTQSQENAYYEQQMRNMNPYDRQNYLNRITEQRNLRITNMISNMEPQVRDWFIQNLAYATSPNHNPSFNQGYQSQQGYQNYNPNLGYLANNRSASEFGYQNQQDVSITRGYVNTNDQSMHSGVINRSSKYDDIPNHNQEQYNYQQSNNNNYVPQHNNQNQTSGNWNPNAGTYDNIFGNKKHNPKQSSNQPTQNTKSNPKGPVMQSMFQELEDEDERRKETYHSFNHEDGIYDDDGFGGDNFISIEDVDSDIELFGCFGDDDYTYEHKDMSDQPDPEWDNSEHPQMRSNRSNLNFNMSNAPTREQQELHARAKLTEMEAKKKKKYYVDLCMRILEKRKPAVNNPPASTDIMDTPMSEVESENKVYVEGSKVVTSLSEAVHTNKVGKIDALGENYMKGVYGTAFKVVKKKVYNHSMKEMLQSFVLNAVDYEDFCNKISGYFPAMLDVVKKESEKKDKDRSKLLKEAYESYTFMTELDRNVCQLLNKFLRETLDVKISMESISSDGMHMMREIQKRYGPSMFEVFNKHADEVISSIKASYNEVEQEEIREGMKSDETFNVEECKYILSRYYVLSMPIDEGKLTFMGDNTIIREDSTGDIGLIFKELRIAGKNAGRQLGGYGVFEMYVLTLTGDLYHATFNAVQRHYKLTKVVNY